MSAHTGDVGHPETAPQLNGDGSDLPSAPRAVVGYRVRINNWDAYAYRDPRAKGGWDPTFGGFDRPKPAIVSRQCALDLLHLCRAWTEHVGSPLTFRLVRVTRRG